MRIKVLSSGFLTTIQDLGRKGFQQFGVSPSGAMDVRAYKLGNMLVGNNIEASSFEITLMGPRLLFEGDGIIALTGADLSAKINGNPVALNKCVQVYSGDLLVFGVPKTGARAYLAVAGGIDTDIVMGSSSTDLKAKIGGNGGKALQKNDVIKVHEHNMTYSSRFIREFISKKFSFNYHKAVEFHKVRVLLGPQDDYFTEKGIETFLSSTYTLTNKSDRMGLRLEGDVIEHSDSADIISDAISFGAIQIPAHGMPIVMMADRQTTGGYPKIGNVISVDLPVMAQLTAGSKMKFELVTLEEAHLLIKEEDKTYKLLAEHLSEQAKRIVKKSTCYEVTVRNKNYYVEVEEIL